ncbi:tetratricopeptide repeat protein [Shewanella xiamenensis]
MLIAFSTIHTAKVLASTQSAKVPSQEQSWVMQQIMQLQERCIRLEILLQQQTQTSSNVKDTEKELQQLQLQLVELKEKLAAQGDNQSKELDSYDRRISDVSLNANFWGCLFTLAIVFIGWSVVAKVNSESKIAAKKFFDDERDTLLKEEMAQLKALRERFENQINELQKDYSARFSGLEQKYLSHNEQLIAKTYLDRAKELENDDKPELAISVYDECFEKFKDTDIPEVKVHIANALRFKARCQRKKLNQFDGAVQTYDVLINLFKDSEAPALKECVVDSFINKGNAYFSLKRYEESIAAYDQAFNFSSNLKDNQTAQSIALSNKANVQLKLDKLDDTLESLAKIINLFESSSEPKLKLRVIKAIFNKAFVHNQLKQYDDAIVYYNQVIAHAVDSESLELKELLWLSCINVASIHSDLEQYADAKCTYLEFLTKYGNSSSEGELNDYMLQAKNGMGFTLLCEAKCSLAKLNKPDAELLINEALTYFDSALSIELNGKLSGVVLGNRAYAFALLGESALADRLFAEALRAEMDGGKQLYEGTLRDLDIHPVQEDIMMREIVDRQWQLWLSEQAASADIAA